MADAPRTRAVTAPPLTLTAFAKLRGVSVKAVSKAIASGRLKESVVRDERGTPAIADPEVADREWAANTRQRVDRPPPEPRRAAPAVGPPPAAPPPVRIDLDVPDYMDSRARKEAAAARREAALADMAELDRDERRGELVAVADARADVIDRFAIVRTRLLSIPSRAAQRLPALAGQMVPVLDELLRDALEELAVDGGDAAA